MDFPLSAILLGFILGGMMEQNLRRALSLSSGDIGILFASPITWLCAIARNTAIDWRRANGGPVLVSEDHAAEVPDTRDTAPERIEAAQDRARIFHCLDALDAKQGSAIRSAFFDGFTYAQLADRMKVPIGTMKGWIRRGLLQLRECLGDG